MLNRINACATLFVCACLVLTTGCGGSEGLAVEGKVEFQDGTPLDAGSVVFDPTTGNEAPRVAGKVTQGSFKLEGDQSPYPGEYIIRVYGETSTDGLDDPQAFAEQGDAMFEQNPVSAKFNDDSELKVEVSDSKREFTFTVERTKT